jgi:DNA-binding XRE family transcriptional regulator
MPRSYIPTDPLLTQLRCYFGISQEDLARYLGVSGLVLGYKQ